MCTVQYNTTVQYLHESCTCSSRVHVQLCKPRCSQMLSTIADSYESTSVSISGSTIEATYYFRIYFWKYHRSNVLLPYLFLEVPSKQRITSVITNVLKYFRTLRKYGSTRVRKYFRTFVRKYTCTEVLSYFRTEIDRIQYTYTYDTFTKVRKYCIFVVSIV